MNTNTEITLEEALEEKWTPDLSAAALREGWNLFTSYGSDNGPLQVQKIDSPDDDETPDLADDVAAHKIVREGGRRHHIVARLLLMRFNEAEYWVVMTRDPRRGRKLVRSMLLERVQGATEREVVVRLANGKVVHISPEFNAINVFPNEQVFAELAVGAAGVQTFNVDMGGKQ